MNIMVNFKLPAAQPPAHKFLKVEWSADTGVGTGQYKSAPVQNW